MMVMPSLLTTTNRVSFYRPILAVFMRYFLEKEEPKATKKTVSNVAKDGKVKAKPAVRKFAKDNGVNINEVTATGPKGTVTKEDVEAFMNQGAVQETVAQTPPPVVQQAPPAAAPPVKGTALCYLCIKMMLTRISS